MINCLGYLVLFVTYFVYGLALNLEVPASKHPRQQCIRDFVQQDQMVVININSKGSYGEEQRLGVKVLDQAGNIYHEKAEILDHAQIAFNSQLNNAVDVCFTNTLRSSSKAQGLSKEVELEVESGTAARDWNAIQAAEKLAPTEVDLLRIKGLIEEVSLELRYLRNREARMRDTNESTNSRVKYFSLLIIISLVVLGAWQVKYLRHYFKVKHII